MYVCIYLLDVHWILRIKIFVLVNNLVEKGLFWLFCSNDYTVTQETIQHWYMLYVVMEQ